MSSKYDKFFCEIMQSKEMVADPPVLFDIGASGQINPGFRKIAKYSICVAFDADDREFNYSIQNDGSFLKYIKINTLVSSTNTSSIDFYLTSSPYCSSSLKPDIDSLDKYVFKQNFIVERKVLLPTITIEKVLINLGLKRIDWIKLDTQGTDLRIFNSIPEEVCERILIAELEPGIIDAYNTEDKLHSVIQSLTDMGFALVRFNIKGTQRLQPIVLDSLGIGTLKRKILIAALPIVPGWAELKFINIPRSSMSLRDLLLSWIFAMEEKQYGLALEIAQNGLANFGDHRFREMIHISEDEILNLVKRKYLSTIIKKVFGKIAKLWVN